MCVPFHVWWARVGGGCTNTEGVGACEATMGLLSRLKFHHAAALGVCVLGVIFVVVGLAVSAALPAAEIDVWYK